jgi:hypothetical protein
MIDFEPASLTLRWGPLVLLVLNKRILREDIVDEKKVTGDIYS